MSNAFFFQAEDGIRDRTVTGVQTCALPIFPPDDGRREPVDGVDVRFFHHLEELARVGREALHVAALTQIGRASCRERMEVMAVVRSSERTRRGFVRINLTEHTTCDVDTCSF